MQEQTLKPRFLIIDQMRALAILLMVYFHASYDLNLFKFIEIDVFRSKFWLYLPKLIVTLFLLCVGMSLCLVHEKNFNSKKFFSRWWKLVIGAVFISLFTYFAFPKRWIYFGTLHTIALCSVMAIPFLKYPKISLLTSFVLLIPALFLNFTWPFLKLPHPTMDYIPSLPWFGVVTLGIFLYHQGFHKLDTSKIPFKGPIIFMSKHSLKIYIIHQPVLFSVVYLTYKYFRN